MIHYVHYILSVCAQNDKLSFFGWEFLMDPQINFSGVISWESLTDPEINFIGAIIN